MSLDQPAAISFDADGTLWDFHKVMRHALGLALVELDRQVGSAADGLTIDRLIEIRDLVAATSAPIRTMEDVRQEAFCRSLREIGRPDDELASRLSALYLHHRFHDIELYPDAAPALEGLRGRYRLGLLTNGNTYPERCGLADTFDFVVLAQDHGFRKPDPRLFHVAVQQCGCRPEEVLHVGDSWENDVQGALDAGLPAVWLNREGAARPTETRGVAEVGSLAELAALL